MMFDDTTDPAVEEEVLDAPAEGQDESSENEGASEETATEDDAA